MSGRVTTWSGLVRAAPQRLERPASVEGVVAVVREAARRGGGLRVMGSGHSFTPLIETSGTLVSLERFAGVEAVEAGQARVRGGTRLQDLNRELAARGAALENLGDIDRQTIAGAVGTGTHGTGAGLGSLSTQVSALEIVTASGEVMECSEERERELFKAAQVSLGALGVVTRLSLRVMGAYRLRSVRRREPLEACLAGLEERRRAHRHFEFFWFPHTDTVQVKLLDIADEPPRRRRWRRFLGGTLLENLAFGLMCRACRLRPALSPAACRLAARLVGEGEEVERSDRALVSARRVRFQEVEYALPAERAAEAVRELQAWIAAARAEVCFPVEVRFVKGDDILLSPAYGRETAYVAVHAYRGMEFRRYFDAAEAVFRNQGGRPHWGKLHTLTAAELAPLYPTWDRFQRVRARLDPQGLLLNDHLRRVLG